MTNKICILILLMLCMSNASASYEAINETLYLYDRVELDYKMQDRNNYDTNIDKVICINCTCAEMHISIASSDDYSFDYELNYAPNETIYYTKLITIKQEVSDTSIFGLYKEFIRTLYVDSVEVATYNSTVIINMGTSSNFRFKSLDRTCTFGEKTVTNTTLFFTELVMDDQYNYIANNTGFVNTFFRTVPDNSTAGYQKNQLGGLTGGLLTLIGKIPLIGKGLYNCVYPIILLIQYVFDFSFSFINLIINDWYYAILLLECFCLFMASQQSGYVNVVSIYISTHALIIMYIYHKIVLPIIELFISILRSIRG